MTPKMNFNRVATIFFCITSILCTQVVFASSTPQLNFIVTGIKGKPLDNVNTRLALIKKRFSHPLTKSSIHAIFRHAQTDIKTALQPFGYYRTNINASLKHQQKNWTAHFDIKPGPKLRVTHLSLSIQGEGKQDEVFETLIHHFPIKQGHTLTTVDYDAAKQSLFNVASHHGYMKSSLIEHKIVIDQAKYTATVIIIFDTGPRFRFGEITLHTGPYAQHFIERYLPFKSGEYYSTDKVQQLQRNLTNSIYFDKVSVDANPGHAKNHLVPVIVTLTPADAQHYTFGAGFGTDTGPRVSGSWQWRRASETGNHMQFSTRLSPIQSSGLASYMIPGSNPMTDQYSINAGAQNTNIDVGNSFMYNLGVAYHHSNDHWQHTYQINYQREHFQVDEEKSQDSELLIPSVRWSFIQADDLVNPRKGIHVSLTVRGAPKVLFSDQNFAQTLVDANWIHPLTSKTRLVTKGSFGMTTVDDFDRLPLSLRFLTGGARSVRAYAYQAIGPGRYLKVGSLELQQEIINHFFVAAFFDAGTASSSLNDALKQSPGLAIGYYSMIGPIELSVAKAIKDPGQPYRISFSMGTNL